MASEDTTPAEQIDKALDEGTFLGEVPDLPEGFTYQGLTSEPNTVPLAIYIGTEKFIIGTATVLGRKVHAQIKPADGRQLERLVTEGIITGVSVYFDKGGPAVPAHPVLPFSSEKNEPSNYQYNFEPTNPMKHIPDIENPLIDPFRTMPPPVDGTILDQETYKKIKIDNVPEGLPKLKGLRFTHEIVDEITNTEERWEDKFPYGKA